MAEPLAILASDVVRGRASTAPAFPAAGDPRFRGAFEALGAFLSSRDEAHWRPAEGSALLLRQVAQTLGPLVSATPEAWVRSAALFPDWEAWSAFIDAVPREAIERCVLDLMRSPTDERVWLDTIGGRVAHREAMRALDEERRTGRGITQWIVSLEHYAGHAMLGENLRVRSQLLARVGGAVWSTWAPNLPHLLLTALAVNDLGELDFTQDAIDGAKVAWADVDQLFVLVALLTRRLIEQCEQIDRSLTHAASMRWSSTNDPAERAEYEAMLTEWRREELPRRLDRLVLSLRSGEPARRAAIVVARGLRATSRGDFNIRQMLRERLVAALAAVGLDSSMAALLADPLDTAGLLAGTQVGLSAMTPQRAEAAMVAYLRWLTGQDLFWSTPLGVDDDDLAEALGKALAATADPMREARALLAAAQVPSQGWGFVQKEWFDSVPRVTHVTIVIAAAGYIASTGGRADLGRGLTDLAATTLATWLREVPMRYSDQHVLHALAYAFAFLAKVDGPASAPRVAAVMRGLDTVDEILAVADNYASNLPAPGMPIDVQRAVRAAFEARRPLLALHPHVSEDSFRRISARIEELARDAYQEAR